MAEILPESDQNEFGSVTLEKPEVELKEPSMYRVLLLNDNFTPMEYVVFVLQAYFNKSLESATQIMLRVHQEGSGVCGIYTRDIAITKVDLVLRRARKDGHPLQCVMEEI